MYSFMIKKSFFGLLFIPVFFSVRAQQASLVLHNAKVYTVNETKPLAEAIAISGDKIIFVGKNEDVKKYVTSSTEVIDCAGRFVAPGLIEGHGHIHGMGASLIYLNLMNVKNWEEIVALVADGLDHWPRLAPGKMGSYTRKEFPGIPLS
jgi:predicted amidohydrolase YtcJ